ncbi:MAG: DUF1697 domain-containing protein [Owenweeksia sp.]
MKTYIALLRGINVSGQKKMPMAQLRGQLEKLGLKDVQTYIQSGNIVFRYADTPAAGISNAIASMIQEEYGFEVPVQVLTIADLEGAVRNNPFLPEHKEDLKLLHVTYLEDNPSEDLLKKLNAASRNDRFITKGKLIYLYCPDGYGRTKLTNTFFESKLKLKATTRNWKTTLKLLEIANNL